MTIEKFAKNCQTKKRYVLEWLAEGLIPNAMYDNENGEWWIPPSARRPYRRKALSTNTNADTLRAHILKAAIQRKHISNEMLGMSRGEFQNMIEELVENDLIRIREEDQTTYYDTTTKSRQATSTTINSIRKFILDCIERGACGVTTAIIQNKNK